MRCVSVYSQFAVALFSTLPRRINRVMLTAESSRVCRKKQIVSTPMKDARRMKCFLRIRAFAMSPRVVRKKARPTRPSSTPT